MHSYKLNIHQIECIIILSYIIIQSRYFKNFIRTKKISLISFKCHMATP